MTLAIDEKYTKQVNSIMAKLPQNPFIIDLIGKGIEISERYNIENFDFRLKLADKAVEFVSKISKPNFYKYHIILSVLLSGVPAEDYEMLDTASGTVKESVELISKFEFNDGYKDMWITLNEIAKKDTDLLYIALLLMTGLAEVAIGDESIAGSYVLAGLAYLEVSLRKSAITIPNNQYELYNQFMNLMMKKAKF